jgi:hypothetical protein
MLLLWKEIREERKNKHEKARIEDTWKELYYRDEGGGGVTAVVGDGKRVVPRTGMIGIAALH